MSTLQTYLFITKALWRKELETHFTDEEIDLEKLNNMLMATLLFNGRTES